MAESPRPNPSVDSLREHEALDTHSEMREISAAAAGFDHSTLEALGKRLQSSPKSNIHAILVVRHGGLAFEHYFSGEDERWGDKLGPVDFAAPTLHDLRSATKSVTGLLVGLALDRGLISSLDQPIMSFFPEHGDLHSGGRDRILLRHLLSMSAGLEWDQYRPVNDPRNNEAGMIRSAEPYRYALERVMVAPPGRKWNYSSGATEILGAILSRAVGMSIDCFAQRTLFQPLGIGKWEWMRFSSQDIASAASGLRLRPRDMAKLGQLVLRRGRWRNEQLVSEQWIDISTSPQILGPEIYFYGYHWILGRSLVGRREVSWAGAVGQGGQRIFILPALDLVVVIAAGLYASPLQYHLPLEILNHHILAALKN